jgi:hypothetical protein
LQKKKKKRKEKKTENSRDIRDKVKKKSNNYLNCNSIMKEENYLKRTHIYPPIQEI